MSTTKLEQVERLTRALIAREAELKQNDEIVKKASFRSHSLRVAIADIRATIAKLIGDAPVEEVSEPATPAAPEEPTQKPDMVKRPGLARTEGTILSRVAASLDVAPRALDATEIAVALGIGIDVVRTSLSKLYARGLITRLGPGEYCSLQYANEIGAEAARKSR